tara:strand:+ start:128 stop:808 length:681 start_codon:yes stop_codon:yes gene_type:complete
MKVLVVVAHPDDEVLGCGGSIAKHSANKDEVHILALGDGITSRYSQEELDEKEVKLRVESIKKDFFKATKLLGAKSTAIKGYNCCRFDLVPLLDITKIIEEHVKKIQPEIIYTHCPYDVNKDHKVIFDAVLTATRPLPNSCVKKILLFEILSSTEWSFLENFRPNVYIDVSDFIDTKIKAMNLYKGEVRNFPHPRSEKVIKALAEKRGSEVGLQNAEAFQLLREII